MKTAPDTEEIEITLDMVEAGVEAFLSFDSRFNTEEEAVTWIFRAMYRRFPGRDYAKIADALENFPPLVDGSGRERVSVVMSPDVLRYMRDGLRRLSRIDAKYITTGSERAK